MKRSRHKNHEVARPEESREVYTVHKRVIPGDVYDKGPNFTRKVEVSGTIEDVEEV